MSDKNLNIASIVDSLAEQEAYQNLTKKTLKAIVDSVVDSISSALESGETVRINGLGTFTVQDTAARTGRNPSTGEELQIPASKRVAFKAASSLKDAVKASV